MTRQIKRKVYPALYPCAQGITWQWYSDVGWVSYDIETSHVIENQYQTNRNGKLDLEATALGIPIYLNLKKMVQINKFTAYERIIQRKVDISLQYPTDKRQTRSSLLNTVHPLPSAVSPTATTAAYTQAINNTMTQSIDKVDTQNTATPLTPENSNDKLDLYCKANIKHDNLNEVSLLILTSLPVFPVYPLVHIFI